MNIIFLDIDGVLNNQNYIINNKKDIDESKIIILKELVDKTHALIVITSAWRIIKKEYERLNEIFNKYELKIFDKTKSLQGKRGLEIKKYLNEHKKISNYVIIDDEIFEDYDDTILQNLVKTSFYQEGLTQEHIYQAEKILLKKR